MMAETEEVDFLDDELIDDRPAWELPSFNPATASWNVTISQADLEKLQAGYEPWDIGNMWYIKAMPRDESNRMHVHFARFCARSPVYTIVVAVSPDGSSGGVIESIIWETREGDHDLSEDWAKREVVLVARSRAECDMPGLPELDREEWWPRTVAYRACSGQAWDFLPPSM